MEVSSAAPLIWDAPRGPVMAARLNDLCRWAVACCCVAAVTFAVVASVSPSRKYALRLPRAGVARRAVPDAVRGRPSPSARGHPSRARNSYLRVQSAPKSPPPKEPPTSPFSANYSARPAFNAAVGLLVAAVATFASRLCTVLRLPPYVWAVLGLAPEDVDYNRDYYADLGVPADASQEEIRKAFRQLARQQHPDIAGSDADPARFQAIKRAYDVLSNPADRQRYNNYRAFGRPRLRQAARSPTPPPQKPRGPPQPDYDPFQAGYMAGQQAAATTQQPEGSTRSWMGSIVQRGLQLFRGRSATQTNEAGQVFQEYLAKALLQELNRSGFMEVVAPSTDVERLYTRPYRRWELLVCTCLKNSRRLTLMPRDNQAVRIFAVSKDELGGQRVAAGPLYLSYFVAVPKGVFVAQLRETLQKIRDDLGRNVMYGG